MLKSSQGKEKVKVILLEGLDPSAIEMFYEHGYTNVEYLSTALSRKELFDKVKDASIIGIRSRTNLTKEVLKKAPNLLAIGCYCIGVNQVDLKQAALQGVPIFNAPHSNTRSVAELVLGLSIMLMRGIFPKNAAAHKGKWLKSAKSSHEVRGKALGIVGYGHIGSQVSVLAESLGMQVYYYDIQAKLPLGNAIETSSLEELLSKADIVTLHVPDTPTTKQMISYDEFEMMRDGAFLINASRGTIVDLDALHMALDTEKIGGAALDVFPKEPTNDSVQFESPFKGNDSVILTPHIGGSTMEAQHNIGLEVSRKLIYYFERGSTEGAVNFPSMNIPQHKDSHRILHIHLNHPGVLQEVNKAIADKNINVKSEYLLTNQDIGYVVLDIDKDISNELNTTLKNIEGTLRTRVLY